MPPGLPNEARPMSLRASISEPNSSAVTGATSAEVTAKHQGKRTRMDLFSLDQVGEARPQPKWSKLITHHGHSKGCRGR